MTDLYVIGQAFQAEVDAEADDPSFDLEAFASPQLSWTTTELTDEKLEKAKREAEVEYVEAIGDDTTADLEWEDKGWEKPKKEYPFYRPSRKLILRDGREVVGMIVIQKIPLEYGWR